METKKCIICEIPMFDYKIRHNGKDVVISRCMNTHGTIDANGNTRGYRAGKKPVRGVQKHFKGLFYKRKEF